MSRPVKYLLLLNIVVGAVLAVEVISRIVYAQSDEIWMAAYRPPVNFQDLEVGLIKETAQGKWLTDLPP